MADRAAPKRSCFRHREVIYRKPGEGDFRGDKSAKTVEALHNFVASGID